MQSLKSNCSSPTHQKCLANVSQASLLIYFVSFNEQTFFYLRVPLSVWDLYMSACLIRKHCLATTNYIIFGNSVITWESCVGKWPKRMEAQIPVVWGIYLRLLWFKWEWKAWWSLHGRICRHCSVAAGRHCLVVGEFKGTEMSEARWSRGETSESWLWDAEDFFFSFSSPEFCKGIMCGLITQYFTSCCTQLCSSQILSLFPTWYQSCHLFSSATRLLKCAQIIHGTITPIKHTDKKLRNA